MGDLVGIIANNHGFMMNYVVVLRQKTPETFQLTGYSHEIDTKYIRWRKWSDPWFGRWSDFGYVFTHVVLE